MSSDKLWISQEEIEELEESRKRNTCSSCGHSKINHSYFNLGGSSINA